MKCPACDGDHTLGEPHTFKHINKIVTRPGCLQCDARDKVIDDLCLHIERLNKRLYDTEGPTHKPEKDIFNHREHMKQVWAKRKAKLNVV